VMIEGPSREALELVEV